jgi:predicted nucleic acid-binding protein
MEEFLLVDSDILIDAGREIDEAINFLLENEDETQLAISAVTQMELMVGCRNKTELRALANS